MDMEKKMKRFRKAQSTLEYFLISAAVVSAFLGAAFLTKVKFQSFVNYFDHCKDALVGGAE
jgi:uncharacterized protein (UPF0333 family)